MRCEPHPISGFVYRELGDGLVLVEDQKRGKKGKFKWDGTWLEGDLTYADPHLLIYVGGPTVPPGWDLFWPMLPPEIDLEKPPLTPEQEAAMAAAMPRIVGEYKPDPGMMTPDGMRSKSHIDQDFLLANDRHPELVPKVYHLKAPMPGGPERVPVDRFFKPEYHQMEVEKLWSKTWQMVCREEDIPEVGDYYVYKIADMSFLIVRTGPNEVKAHYNACMHRGRNLRECDGKRATEFRCPFHGWTWAIDGSIKHITTEWDFPGVRRNVAQLPGAKVASWGGFIFINPDPNAISLEDFMGPEMIGHYAKFKFENRYKQAHVSRVIKANWKVTVEAFAEAYHVVATHPQLLLAGGDFADCHYDVFGNWVRLGHVESCNASPQRDIFLTPEQHLERYRAYADANKAYLKTIIGDEADTYSDAELTDVSFSILFPNFAPWGGFGRIVYRWRPNGNNPDECLWEVMLLTPWPSGKPKPPPAKLRELAPDEPWANATELGNLGRILDQDIINIPKVQSGLKTKQPPYVWYSSYQEGPIRNFHRIYDRMLGLTRS